MNRPDLIHAVCRRFCSYYKPGKDEDLACQGYLVIEKLSVMGKELKYAKTDRGIDPGIVRILEDRICSNCAYREHDCDFADRREDASPCGGFIFLGHLLISDAITVDDIDDMG